MKRPALVSALAVISAVVAAQFLPHLIVCGILIGAVFALVLSLIIKNKELFLVVLSLLLTLASCTVYDKVIYAKDKALEGCTVTLTGRVEKKDSDICYKVKPYSIILDDEETVTLGDIIVYVSPNTTPLEMYSSVSGSGKLYSVTNKFSLGDGAYLQMNLSNITRGEKATPHGLDLSYRIRLYINSACERLGIAEGGFVESLLTGNNRLMLYGDVEDFRSVGLAHILAVSGLHLSVCLGFLDLILRRIGLYRPVRIALNIIFIALMLIVANFSPSICRAAVMNLIFLFSDIMSLPADHLNSLGGSVAVIGIIKPVMLLNAGFIMSAASVLGIVLLYPLFELRIRNKPLYKLYKAAAVSLSATLVITPLSVYYFGVTSLVSLPANIFANMFIPLILLGGLILCVLAPIPNISGVIVIVLRFIVNIFLSVIRFFGERFSQVEINAKSMLVLLGVLVALGILLYFFKKKIRKTIPIICLCTVFVLSILVGLVHNNTVFNYHIQRAQNITLAYAQTDTDIIVTLCNDKRSAVYLKNLLEETGRDKAEVFVVPDYSNNYIHACNYAIDNKLTKCIVLPDIDTNKKYDIITRAKKNKIDVLLISGSKNLEYTDLTLSFGLIRDSSNLYYNKMYSCVYSGGLTVLNTYDCDSLVHTPKADVIIASTSAAENTSYTDARYMLIQGGEMPSKKSTETYILSGYETDINLNEHGKFTLSREKK